VNKGNLFFGNNVSNEKKDDKSPSPTFGGESKEKHDGTKNPLFFGEKKDGSANLFGGDKGKNEEPKSFFPSGPSMFGVPQTVNKPAENKSPNMTQTENSQQFTNNFAKNQSADTGKQPVLSMFENKDTQNKPEGKQEGKQEGILFGNNISTNIFSGFSKKEPKPDTHDKPQEVISLNKPVEPKPFESGFLQNKPQEAKTENKISFAVQKKLQILRKLRTKFLSLWKINLLVRNLYLDL